MDYDQRLQQEVEALRARTALEMEQLKTQTREMFERENRYELTRVSSGKLIQPWYTCLSKRTGMNWLELALVN